MIIPMILFEGIVLSFIILVACVVGIANGPVGLVCLYEREVWDRCIENGLSAWGGDEFSQIFKYLDVCLSLYH